MRLLAVITWPGWRLRSFNERLHWAARRKANQPPVPSSVKLGKGLDLGQVLVNELHKRRIVEITRVGPRGMDMDNLAASVKPALDRIKRRMVLGYWADGYIYDDSPKYCKLVVKQRKGPYEVIVKVYE